MGQVGCGKSTLLSAILGETEKLQGKVFVEVGIAPALYSGRCADSFRVFFLPQLSSSIMPFIKFQGFDILTSISKP